MELDHFLASLHRRMPDAPVTRILVVLNLALFLLMALAGGDLLGIPAERLTYWGGNQARLTLAGEPWRLLVSVFLHGGLLHVGLNMLALYQVGQLVERMFGSARFIALYLGSGLLASLVSVWWRQDVVSVGASGAIFGIFGALLAFLLTHRRSLPASVFGPMRSMTLSFVGYSLLLGFAIPGVDNAAHIGGLLGGVIIGGALAAGSAGRMRALLGLALAAGLSAGFWLAAERPHPASAAVAQFIDGQQLLVARESEAMEALRTGRSSAEEVVQIVDTELKPNWDKLISGLEAEAVDGGTRTRALLDYARLERSALEAISLGLSTGHSGWLHTAGVLRGEARVALARAVAAADGHPPVPSRSAREAPPAAAGSGSPAESEIK